MRASTCWIALSLFFVLSACEESVPHTPQIRPVRTIVVQKRVLEESTALTGHVRARDEVSLAFRIDGKLIERLVNIGDRVTAGQLVARVDPQNELNALRSAQADLAAVHAELTHAEGT